MNTNNEKPIKPYTLKELAALYNITPRTFKTWMQPHAKAIGEKRGWYFNLLQVRIIFDAFGMPE